MHVLYSPPTPTEGTAFAVVLGMEDVVSRGWAAIHWPGINLISSSAMSLWYPLPRTASNTN